MQRPIIHIRSTVTKKLIYVGFSDLAAERLKMSEEALLEVLLVKGYFIFKPFVVTFRSIRNHV